MARTVWMQSRIVALLLGAALVTSACSQRSVIEDSGPAPASSATPDQRTETAEPASGPPLIAVLAPTGSSNAKVAADANAIVNAARLAAQGTDGVALRLRTYDTQGTQGGADAAARRAVADGARLILGPLFGANTPAVGAVASDAGIRVLSFSTDSSVAGGPVYVSGYLPEVEAERILSYASSQGLGSVGVYAPQNAYGSAALRGAEQAAPRSGTFIATRLSYPRSFQGIQQTAGEFANAARVQGVQAVLLPDSGDGLKIVGSFLDFNGLSPASVRYLGLGSWETRSTLSEASLRGGWFAGADPADVQRFATLYSERYGATPPFIAVLGYDGVEVAEQLIAAARASGDDEIFSDDAITRPEGFMGALGPLRFEPDGTSVRALAVLQVGTREFEILDPAPRRFGAGF